MTIMTESTGASAGAPPAPGVCARGPQDAASAAFLGRITAGATHEFRNVLAIINESAGLVDDLLASNGTGALARDKMEWATGRIAAQVARGAELCTALNHVAHGLDRAVEVVPLTRAVADAALLCGRAARQAQRRLAVLPAREEPIVERCALHLYMGLIAVLEWCVPRVPEGGTLAVRAELRDGRPAAVFRSEPAWQTELAENGGAGAAVDRELLRSLRVDLEVPTPGSELLLLFQ